MDELVLKLEFNGRRKINSSTKKTYYIVGVILFFIGLLGIIRTNMELNLFFLPQIIGGILNVVYGLIGKELMKEKNSISISGEEIEYKNSFKNPKKIKINDLLDLRIDTAKVEFVMKDQRVKSYDFSVFERQELGDIYGKLEKVKVNLIK